MATSSSLLAFLLGFALLGLASAKGSAPLNLTEILERGSQYNKFINLLSINQVGIQIQNQLNNSHDGVTVFAPTDNAFSNLKAGLLNSLTPQQQTAFVLYHVVPKFYSLEDFQTASNPLRTQATGNGGDFYLNVSSTTQQTNVSTGLVNVPLGTPLNLTMPLAVYSIDTVLLPYDLFGPKKNKTTTAPAPATDDSGTGAPSTPADTSDGKNGTKAASETATNAGARMGGGWRWMAGTALLGALLMRI